MALYGLFSRRCAPTTLGYSLRNRPNGVHICGSSLSTWYAIAREPAPSAEMTGIGPGAFEGIVSFATIFRMSIHRHLLGSIEEDSHLLVDQSAQRNLP